MSSRVSRIGGFCTKLDSKMLTVGAHSRSANNIIFLSQLSKSYKIFSGSSRQIFKLLLLLVVDADVEADSVGHVADKGVAVFAVDYSV